MSTPLRSDGWIVRPSFVPNGATEPVTLLTDENGLTQLAGEPPVAWQTPWSELTNVQLMRFSKGMVLFATANAVRYSWRSRSLVDFERLRAVVLDHGGTIATRQRRAGIYAVAAIVLVASLAGGLGSWLNRGAGGSRELADARGVVLSLKDLPTGWYSTGNSVLGYIFPPSATVVTSSTVVTTLPKVNSPWAKVTAVFQNCLGVSNARDRVFGAAGQQPDYQVSSMIFRSPAYGGTEVASTVQYYRTTTMVRRDVKEMSKANFGSCFVTSNVAIVSAALGSPLPQTNIGTGFRPLTFVRGWSRGGVAPVSLPGVAKALHLVMVVTTRGHYEVTLGALVDEWPKAKSFLATLTSTLLSRMTSSASAAV